jgi:hypothetical protein
VAEEEAVQTGPLSSGGACLERCCISELQHYSKVSFLSCASGEKLLLECAVPNLFGFCKISPCIKGNIWTGPSSPLAQGAAYVEGRRQVATA